MVIARGIIWRAGWLLFRREQVFRPSNAAIAWGGALDCNDSILADVFLSTCLLWTFDDQDRAT